MRMAISPRLATSTLVTLIGRLLLVASPRPHQELDRGRSWRDGAGAADSGWSGGASAEHRGQRGAGVAEVVLGFVEGVAGEPDDGPLGRLGGVVEARPGQLGRAEDADGVGQELGGHEQLAGGALGIL